MSGLAKKVLSKPMWHSCPCPAHHPMSSSNGRDPRLIQADRDPRLIQSDILIEFSRRRADILYALDPTDISAIASLALIPRAHREKRLISALGRLRETFPTDQRAGRDLELPEDAGAAVQEGCQTGSASLQDLLRVLRDWSQQPSAQHPMPDAATPAQQTLHGGWV